MGSGMLGEVGHPKEVPSKPHLEGCVPPGRGRESTCTRSLGRSVPYEAVKNTVSESAELALTSSQSFMSFRTLRRLSSFINNMKVLQLICIQTLLYAEHSSTRFRNTDPCNPPNSLRGRCHYYPRVPRG